MDSRTIDKPDTIALSLERLESGRVCVNCFWWGDIWLGSQVERECLIHHEPTKPFWGCTAFDVMPGKEDIISTNAT